MSTHKDNSQLTSACAHIEETTDDSDSDRNDKVTFQWLRQTLPLVLSFIGVMVTLGTITLRNESRLTTVETGVSYIQLQLERVNDKLDRIEDRAQENSKRLYREEQKK